MNLRVNIHLKIIKKIIFIENKYMMHAVFDSGLRIISKND